MREGKLAVKIDTAVSEHKYDYLYRVEARITDAAKREISGRGWVVATYGSFILNVRPERYFYTPGSPAAFMVEARDYDRQPVATRVHVELLRWNWRDKDRYEPKGATDVQTGAGRKCAGRTDAAAAGRIVPREGLGTHARGTGRRAVRVPVGLGRQRRRLRLPRESQRDDHPGQEDLSRGRDGQAADRGGTGAHTVVRLGGRPRPAAAQAACGRRIRPRTFDVPVTAQDEPGITVNATFVRGGNFYSGTKYLRVPPVEHQMNVKVATDKPQYQPGQTAEYSIDVTGMDGKPVPRAEFSLGVVDEAIYAIRRDTTQDILAFFFGREWNRVFTEDSLNYYFSGEAGKRRMRLAELRPPSRLAQLKPDRLVQPKVRKAFPDTAFWSADVVTDGAGHARARVAFPDSLTTWRATARGITADTKVGSAVQKTIVRKNLILRLAVPRFFVQGDEVVISALVHNYLTEAKTARVSLDVAGAGRAGRRDQGCPDPQPRRGQGGLARAREAGAQRHSDRARR